MVPKSHYRLPVSNGKVSVVAALVSRDLYVNLTASHIIGVLRQYRPSWHLASDEIRYQGSQLASLSHEVYAGCSIGSSYSSRAIDDVRLTYLSTAFPIQGWAQEDYSLMGTVIT